ncbi:MAG: DUF928 domain-containing protein [Microcoleaceae cyanobacterium]
MLPVQATSIRSRLQTVMPESTHLGQTPLTKPALAQLIASESRISQTQWNGFEPPQRGIPGRREAGGTRGPGCVVPTSGTNFKPLTALIPASTLGRTATDELTFFYYLPFALEAAAVEFELTDEEDQTLYDQSFMLSNTEPGIVQLNFSRADNLPKLGVDKNYRWYLTIKCNVDDPSSNLVLHGWVQRVKLTSAQKILLSRATPEERLQFYADKGLWYETLAALAQLRSSNPSSRQLKTEWSSLLNAVGLDNLANQPIVPSQLEVSSELDELGSRELER